ncbi:MAG: hypothetical protein GY915_04110 [bacterium]|nr:hypothetical protein [bacterium]
MKIVPYLLFCLIFLISGCDSNLPPSEEPKIEEAKQKCFPIVEGLPAIASAGSRRCMVLWRPALEAFSEFDRNPNEEAFRTFLEAIPDPSKEFYDESGVLERCGFQNVIIDAYMNRKIFDWSTQVFDLTVFLARLQHAEDGGFTTAIRMDAVILLEKDPTAFLKALTQEEAKLTDKESLLTWTIEFVDQPNSVRMEGLQKRQELLRSVQDKDLQEMRDILIKALEEEKSTYCQT